MKKSILFIQFLFVFLIPEYSQVPGMDDIYRVAEGHMRSYFSSGTKQIAGIDTIYHKDEADMLVLNLEGGGWILLSAEMKAMPVIAYNTDGSFFTGRFDSNIAFSDMMSSYSEQIRSIRKKKYLPVHEGWKISGGNGKGMEDDMTLVGPLIDATWGQGTGWNIYCPIDADGPGGHTYVGCVATAMAQALSVYAVPDTGKGSKKYETDDYGTLEVIFSETGYKWDLMSMTVADEYNALLLYHCAVAVGMNFGPGGSSARTSSTRSAMKDYFKMSAKSIFWERKYHEDKWTPAMIENLTAGHPLIYSGNGENGGSGHAFNIDGFNAAKDGKTPVYFHVNWGWAGNQNGYYIIDDLTPGSRDYSEDQTAIFLIQPYYFPTGIVLKDTIVPLGVPAGTAVTRVKIIDEAVDNEYEIDILSDSTYTGSGWVNDYYMDGDSLRTGIVFTGEDSGYDTLLFMVKDNYDNYIERGLAVLVMDTTGQSSTGVFDKRTEEIKIYPNPARLNLNIEFGNDIPVSFVNLYNIMGLQVKRIEQPGGYVNIYAGGMKEGIYLIEIVYYDGFVSRHKVLIL